MDETDEGEKNAILLLLKDKNMVVVNLKQKLKIKLQEFENKNKSLVKDLKDFSESLANMFSKLHYICSNMPKI